MGHRCQWVSGPSVLHSHLPHTAHCCVLHAWPGPGWARTTLGPGPVRPPCGAPMQQRATAELSHATHLPRSQPLPLLPVKPKAQHTHVRLLTLMAHHHKRLEGVRCNEHSSCYSSHTKLSTPVCAPLTPCSATAEPGGWPNHSCCARRCPHLLQVQLR